MHFALFALALISLSTAPILARLAGTNPETIGFWRLFFAGLVMFIFASRKGVPFNKLATISQPALRHSIFSGLFLFAHLWTYFYSAQNTRIANTVIIFAANPIFTAFAAWLFLSEKIQRKVLLAYALAFAGIFLLLQQKMNLSGGHIWGDMSALLSAVFFSGYLLYGRHARLEIDNQIYTLLIYSVAAICFLFTIALKGQSIWVEQPRFWWAVAAMVLFPTLWGHALFTYLIKFLDVNWMSCGKLIEPPLSSLMALFLFSESLNSSAVWSFALTSASVLILVLSRPKLTESNNPQLQLASLEKQP